jgi:hypothetical protein
LNLLKAAICVVLVLVFSQAACNPSLPGYRQARSDWTRSKRVYSEIELQAAVHAILKTAQFRRQYVEEFGRMFALSAQEKATMMANELADARTNYVVVVLVSAPNVPRNDLARSAGIWRIKLANRKGDVVEASQIRELNFQNPTWRALYPALTIHHRIWEIRFPKVAASGKPLVHPGQTLDFFISGAAGQIKLSWKL